MATALMLVIRLGIPMAVLFVTSYCLERRQNSPAAEPHLASREKSQVHRNDMTDKQVSDRGLSNVANEIRLDALSPLEIAGKAEDIGVGKASLDFWSMFALAILAGAFIAIGANFSTLVQTGNSLGYGMNRLVGGLVFSVGLILVVVAGAELFTGNNLIAMAWLSSKISLTQLLRNWAVVYAGNFVGSVGMAVIVYLTNQWAFDGYKVGALALNIANAKVNLTFTEALARGILCNVLVCLAVWMCLSSRSTMDKILAVILPISAFVASGFEHSVANMYFIPIGVLLKSNTGVMVAAGKTAGELANLCTLGLIRNLIPVTIGNIIGGGFMVATIYWFIYLRPREAREPLVPRHVLKVLHYSPRVQHSEGGRG